VSVIAEVLLALAGIMLVSTVAVVVGVRIVLGRLRRSRAVNSSVLRARAHLSAGRQHEVLVLRVRVADLIDSGAAALDIAGRSGTPLGDLRALFERIRADGAALDAHLTLLLSERDTEVLAEAIPVARGRVDQIGVLVSRLRLAVADGIGDPTDDSLALLRAELDREIQALSAGRGELHRLSVDDRTQVHDRTHVHDGPADHAAVTRRTERSAS
jgi:hypothetical protein